MRPQPRRFALFTNGSHLSRAVLQTLIERAVPPALIVLPEYPPANTVGAGLIATFDNRDQHPVRQLAPDITCCYAPQGKQLAIIDELNTHAIELMLVACWPYRLDGKIMESLNDAALNLHPAKLPLFRGADPVGEQLKSGRRPFAVSLHKLSAEFDRGDLVKQADVALTAEQLERYQVEQACAERGVSLFIELLRENPTNWQSWPQPDLPQD